MRRFLARRKEYVLAFLAAALAGLAIRVYALNVVVGLFGAEPGDRLFIFLPEVRGLLVPALIALLVGYVLPKGFFLWGIAVVLLHPLVEAVWINRALGAGVVASSELSGLIIITATEIIVFMVLCTIAAALGAGLRLLWWRFRGESVRGRLGMFSGSNDPAR